ncbi:MAG: hypothetical protein AAGU12_14550, partial [Clostridiales bacterium]
KPLNQNSLKLLRNRLNCSKQLNLLTKLQPNEFTHKFGLDRALLHMNAKIKQEPGLAVLTPVVVCPQTMSN